MSKIYMLVGLPASGKSTYAKELAEKEEAIILSSDSLREELYGDVNHQDNNGELFQELYRRAKMLLNSGTSVIIDATNISRKRRIHFVNEFKNFNKTAIYFSTSFEECVSNDDYRIRKVGKRVIERMYKQLQIPFKEEGWDAVEYRYSNFEVSNKDFWDDWITECWTYQSLANDLKKLGCFDSIIDLSHDSKYHSLSVSRHTYHVWEYLLELQVEIKMLWAALFHDVGKGFCKNFKDGSRYANYIGHENVSAQIALHMLGRLGYEEEFCIETVKLIQHHMDLMNDPNGKVRDRLLSWYGEGFLKKLELLHEADLQAK